MRKVLETVSYFCCAEDPDWTDLDGQMVIGALSADAGRGYISREQARPLVEALKIANSWPIAGNRQIVAAIAHARTLGL